jgi:hypothetical protein
LVLVDNKLQLATETLFEALTTVWEDNGNIMADAVRDSVISNLSEITGLSEDEIGSRIAQLVDQAQ